MIHLNKLHHRISAAAIVAAGLRGVAVVGLVAASGAVTWAIADTVALTADQTVAIQQALSTALANIDPNLTGADHDAAVAAAISQVVQDAVAANGADTAGAVTSTVIAAAGTSISADVLGAGLGAAAVAISATSTSAGEAVAQTVANEAPAGTGTAFATTVTAAGGPSTLSTIATSSPSTPPPPPPGGGTDAGGDTPPPPPPCNTPSCT